MHGKRSKNSLWSWIRLRTAFRQARYKTACSFKKFKSPYLISDIWHLKNYIPKRPKSIQNIANILVLRMRTGHLGINPISLMRLSILCHKKKLHDDIMSLLGWDFSVKRENNGNGNEVGRGWKLDTKIDSRVRVGQKHNFNKSSTFSKIFPF